MWETNLDFFEAVIDYYKDSKVVRCYAQGGVCDSDEESIVIVSTYKCHRKHISLLTTSKKRLI